MNYSLLLICVLCCCIRQHLKKDPSLASLSAQEEEKIMETIEMIREKRKPAEKGPMNRPRKELLDIYRALWERLPEAKEYYGYDKQYIPSDVNYLYTDVVKDVADMIHANLFHGMKCYIPSSCIPTDGEPAQKPILLPDAKGKVR